MSSSLLQQLALLAYINGDPRGKDLYNATVGVNLAMNLHQKFKSSTKGDALRAVAVNGVTEYIKHHPNASEEQIAAEVVRQISEFVKAYRS
ncbi:hypothetical protein TrispH2_002366 [Trichoplax sp. H2]|nr:hypothetical protein TrispH2_002366 [Trichoplax sp. H2]|eukprot:RDD44934.1 hypothetical protein TrispH2_002366 [Trichoplax sp. H2]